MNDFWKEGVMTPWALIGPSLSGQSRFIWIQQSRQYLFWNRACGARTSPVNDDTGVWCCNSRPPQPPPLFYSHWSATPNCPPNSSRTSTGARRETATQTQMSNTTPRFWILSVPFHVFDIKSSLPGLTDFKISSILTKNCHVFYQFEHFLSMYHFK